MRAWTWASTRAWGRDEGLGRVRALLGSAIAYRDPPLSSPLHSGQIDSRRLQAVCSVLRRSCRWQSRQRSDIGKCYILSDRRSV
eukprot:1337737-Pleurochrysis_carterae.AAC.1